MERGDLTYVAQSGFIENHDDPLDYHVRQHQGYGTFVGNKTCDVMKSTYGRYWVYSRIYGSYIFCGHARYGGDPALKLNKETRKLENVYDEE